MSAKIKLSIGAAIAATFLINTNALSQTTVENPPGTTANQANDDSAEASLQLQQVPEAQLDSAQALQVKPGGLTADAVARRAVKTSPTVRARQAEIDAAQAKVDNAVAQFIPRLTLKASYTRMSEVDNALEGAIVGAGEASERILIGPCYQDPTSDDYNPASTEQCAITDGNIPHTTHIHGLTCSASDIPGYQFVGDIGGRVTQVDRIPQ